VLARRHHIRRHQRNPAQHHRRTRPWHAARSTRKVMTLNTEAPEAPAAPAYVPGHQLLAGKSVLITAAAGVGIGFAAARRCAEEGCRALMISDIHPKRLDEAVARLRAETGLQAVHGQLCDVSDEAQVRALVAAAEEALGGTDVLINNAGLGG